jgi:uncharacterized delta-60 repeat protein
MAATVVVALVFVAPAGGAKGPYDDLGDNTYGTVSAVQGDGRILISGATDSCDPSNTCHESQAFVARLLHSGRPDPSFGRGDGIQRVRVRGPDAGVSNTIPLQDGKIIVGGSSVSDDTSKAFIARLKPNGLPDRRFGKSGKVVVPQMYLSGGTVAIDGDGRIIFVGYDYGRLVIGALLPGGEIDKSYGTDGFINRRFLPSDFWDYAGDLTALPDGRILIAGTAESDPSHSRIALLSMLPDGSPDPSFGGGDGLAIGPTVGDPHSSGGNLESGAGSAVVTSERITVVGYSGYVGTHICPAGVLTRFDSAGEWDPSYGAGGAYLLPCAYSFVGAASGSSMLVSGTIETYDQYLMPVAGRIYSDGSPDLDYNREPRLRGLRPGGLEGWGTGAAATGSSALFSASVYCPGNPRTGAGCRAVTVTKLGPDGRLRRSFGRAGIASLPPIRICRRAPLSPCPAR